jgi:prepilin-type processing-associated H-X9-DG protein
MNDESSPADLQATPQPHPTKKSRLAIASLALGILSVPPILAWILHLAFEDVGAVIGMALGIIGMPIAFVCGIVALNRIRKSGGRITGRGQAVAGLIVGVISFSLYLAMILPAIAGTREMDRRFQCMNNLKQIGVAISLYADAHDGNIPQSFGDLRPYATNLDKLLICPSAKDKGHPSYQIVFGGEKWERWNTNDNAIDAIVVTESTNDHHSGYNALYNDGHVSWVFTTDR